MSPVLRYRTLPTLTFILQTRAGSHDDLPVKKINVAAFSFSKTPTRTSPESYTRKFTGIGGTRVRFSILDIIFWNLAVRSI